MVGPPRRGHPAACLARAGPDRPCRAGRRTQHRPPLPAVWFFGPRRPACRPGVAGRAPRDRQAAQPKGDRRAKNRRTGMRREPVAVMSEAIRPAKPTGKSMRHAAGRPKGAWAPVQRPGALRGAFDDRGPGSRDGNRARAAAPAGMPKGARRAGSKAAKAARGDAKRARRP